MSTERLGEYSDLGGIKGRSDDITSQSVPVSKLYLDKQITRDQMGGVRSMHCKFVRNDVTF
jgi:hypothetical protein